VKAAAERVQPKCRYFGTCGGCSYQHTDYATQLNWKLTILRETLERGGVRVEGEIGMVSAEPWSYRNRVRMAFDAAGNPGYRGRRSHGVIAVSECPIAAPVLIEAANAFVEVRRRIAPALQATEIALFCNADESALLASVFVARAGKARLDELANALKERVPRLIGMELVVEGGKGQQPRTVATWGASAMNYAAAGFDYRVDHGAFFQVNRWLVDGLVERVTAGRKGKLAWDLFAGVGLFARRLSATFERVIAVESAPTAIAGLEANLEGSAGTAVRAQTQDFLRRGGKGQTPELIVVDPPRTGLGAEVTTLLASTGADEIVYVSCDPATLARDLRGLTGAGYKIEAITLCDLFPQTYHLETVVELRRV
jgi:23S rRNA (uracil1939-C5)-methyltransferase